MAENYTVRLDPETESDYRTGTIEPGGYKFDVLAFAQPSIHGIDNGRISKLHIWDADREAVIEYDRGWPVDDNENPELPTPDQAKMIEAIKAQFPGELSQERADNFYTEIARKILLEGRGGGKDERQDDENDMER